MGALIVFFILFLVGYAIGRLIVWAYEQLMSIHATWKARAVIEQQSREAEQRIAHISQQAQDQMVAALIHHLRQRYSSNQDSSYF